MAGNINVYGISATDNTKQAFDSVNRNMDRTSKNAQKMNGQLRLMRGGMGQLGHQIQDVAVQLQMGQNPLMVLTQQGSQVASLFGPQGAVIGAIGAVAGALAAAFIPSLFDAEEKTDSLAEAMKVLSNNMDTNLLNSTYVLTEQIKELASVSEDYARIALRQGVIAASLEFEQQQKSVSDQFVALAESFNRGSTFIQENSGLTKDLADKYKVSKETAYEFLSSLRSLARGHEGATLAFAAGADALLAESQATDSVKKEFGDMLQPMVEAAVGMQTLTDRIEKHQDALNDLPGAIERSNKKMKEVPDSNESFINRLIRQGETYKMSVSERMQWELDNTTRNLDAQERIQIEAAIKRARDLEAAIQAEKDLREQQIADEKTLSLELAAAREIERAQGEIDKPREKATRDFKRLSATYDTRMQTIMTREQEELDILNEYAKLGAAQHERAEAMKAEITERYATQRMVAEMDVAEQQRQVMGMQVQALQGFTQFMSQNLQEGSSIQKAFYAATQAAQAAMTIINAHSAGFAATRNMLAMGADPATALATGKFITGVGYAQAAMIVAQTMASFEGGGFTGRGSRSGGLDGKGGFMAMLHPNETVLDHSKGQGAGITIVNNVDARGAGPEVDQKIQQAMQVTSQQTIASVQDLMRRRRFV